MISAATATATIEAPRSGASIPRRSTAKVDSAAVPAADVRTVGKRLRHEMDDDDSFELSPTTKQMRLRLNSDEESASMSVDSNDDMSVEGSIGEDATNTTHMEVDSPRPEKRKRGDEHRTSSITETSGPSTRRKKRGVMLETDPMVVDDVPMTHEVEFLTNDGLNGPYWQIDDLDTSDHQCADLSGIEIEVRPYFLRSKRKRSKNSSSRMPPVGEMGAIFKGGDVICMDTDDDFEDDFTHRSFLDLISDSDEDSDDGESSIMSDLTENSNVYTGADSSDFAFSGFDVRAFDFCAERLHRMVLCDADQSPVMDVDDDAGSEAFGQYISLSAELYRDNRSVYRTRARARAEQRFTRRGTRYY